MLCCTCKKHNADEGGGSSAIDVAGATKAFYAFEGNSVKFVVLPLFDWTANRQSIKGPSGSRDGSHYWEGEFVYNDGRRWSYSVADESARFGKYEYDLGRGEVFLLLDGHQTLQLKGSRGGAVDNPQLAEQLARLIETHKSEQDRAGQPPARKT